MAHVYAYRSIKAMDKLLSKITDDLPAVVAGDGHEFPRLKDTDTVLGVLPVQIRKLFVASAECVRKSVTYDNKADSTFCSVTEKEEFDKKSRQYMRMSSLFREMAWAEATAYLEIDLGKNHHPNIYLRENWQLATGPCECPEHTAARETANALDPTDDLRQELAEAIDEGELPDGIQFRHIPGGGVVMSMNRREVLASLEKRKAEKGQQAKKPN